MTRCELVRCPRRCALAFAQAPRALYQTLTRITVAESQVTAHSSESGSAAHIAPLFETSVAGSGAKCSMGGQTRQVCTLKSARLGFDHQADVRLFSTKTTVAIRYQLWWSPVVSSSMQSASSR